MKRKKFLLKDLKVESFVTKEKKALVKGGAFTDLCGEPTVGCYSYEGPNPPCVPPSANVCWSDIEDHSGCYCQ